MKKGLVIVESPTKVRTLKKYLGKDYDVKASVGHIKDLPRKRLGVDKEHDFKPEYEVIRGKGKIIKELKSAANKVEDVFLAPDPDREGEAIAWHIAQELKPPKNRKRRFHRVLFHELTAPAIREAINKPGELDHNRFESQQARRILDRLVGYEISPLLWEKVRRGLSAGRVQSVAVRLICDREREIQAFVPEEYWSITADLEGDVPPPFQAAVATFKGKKIRIPDGDKAASIVKELERSEFQVKDVKKRQKKRNPYPPFITSTMQQDAARRLGFSAKKTMMLAQRLYEGVELGSEGPVGLITYMRTDSTRVAKEAAVEARSFIEKRFGKEYLPPSIPVYKKGKSAQDAHEAIRPTSVMRHPDDMESFLDRDAARLYRLIWTRFVASQMAPAILDQTTIVVQAGDYQLRATGTIVRFKGFTELYQDVRPKKEGKESGAESESGVLPDLKAGDRLKLLKLQPKQHFTQPPPRFSEASLIKALEEKGIGRPSTYATILSTIQDKEYVKLDKKRFYPTELGFLVTDLLTSHFPEILDAHFTAALEKELDGIEEGAVSWIEVLRRFYDLFSQRLATARKEMKSVKATGVPSGLKCEKCGREMVIKYGRAGEFLACSGYPECRNTKDFTRDESGEIKVVDRQNVETGFTCEKCGSPMVLKKGRYGEFLACSAYPECRNTMPVPTGVKCPEEGCDGDIIKKSSRRGKTFYGCNRYPACKYASWDRPVQMECPACGSPVLVVAKEEGDTKYLKCPNKKCGYRTTVKGDEEK